MIKLVKNKLSSSEFENGVILDGFPRNLNQAIEFESISHIDLVINTTLDNDILIQKLLGRRVCGNCGKNYNICSINQVKINKARMVMKWSPCFQKKM
jgi:adenylate kinase